MTNYNLAKKMGFNNFNSDSMAAASPEITVVCDPLLAATETP